MEKYNLLELRSKGIKPGFRAYSLANPPHDKEILMLNVRIATPPPGTEGIPPGFGSSYVFGLEPGDRVMVSGLRGFYGKGYGPGDVLYRRWCRYGAFAFPYSAPTGRDQFRPQDLLLVRGQIHQRDVYDEDLKTLWKIS